ncbi:MAG: GNAT family N-acetyltransferase [Planctomycetes bacterium]|nr:GNAT family N-acetyltransferase [Planctomycetota bacterium]MBL7106072.1 GNAT family N-acetyltransferase [Phycisphaerae bacterium]
MKLATDYKIIKVSSPLRSKRAWQIESFLLKIFEYGNYSFAKALAGNLAPNLLNTFFLAQYNNEIIATAGSLYSSANPSIALLGPVCVKSSFRRNGLAFHLCSLLLSHLQAQQVKAVYLGVKQDNPARKLYAKLGFNGYNGLVMRKLFCKKQDFNRRYSPNKNPIIRKMSWQDFPEVSALICEPAGMYTFDFNKGLYSTRYAQINKFLPIFPEMMADIEKNNDIANVLINPDQGSITGLVRINCPKSSPQRHLATLEFFVLDNFLNKSADLINAAILQFRSRVPKGIICYCLECDGKKKNILQSLGFVQYSYMPDFVNIRGRLRDVLILKLDRN